MYIRTSILITSSFSSGFRMTRGCVPNDRKREGEKKGKGKEITFSASAQFYYKILLFFGNFCSWSFPKDFLSNLKRSSCPSSPLTLSFYSYFFCEVTLMKNVSRFFGKNMTLRWLVGSSVHQESVDRQGEKILWCGVKLAAKSDTGWSRSIDEILEPSF